MQSEPCKSPLKCVKNVKSLHSLLSLKYPTVTFLPFNLHISNYQHFIKTMVVLCLVCQDKSEDILCHKLSLLHKGKHIVS